MNQDEAAEQNEPNVLTETNEHNAVEEPREKKDEPMELVA